MQKENIPQLEVDEFNSKKIQTYDTLLSYHDTLNDDHTQMADHHRKAWKEVKAKKDEFISTQVHAPQPADQWEAIKEKADQVINECADQLKHMYYKERPDI